MEIACIALAIVVPLLIASSIWTGVRRGRAVLHTWATEHTFQLIEVQYAWWLSARGVTIFHVSLRDMEGRVRSATVRCGGFMMGMPHDEVAVHWQD